MMLMIPLNMLTGTSKAFSLFMFLLTLVLVLLFNIIRLHRKLCSHKCINVIFDNLWLIGLFFFYVNQWGAKPVSQPYNII